jgi:CheY-like chemotaxis protein
MVVEDDADSRDALADILLSEGYEVRTAANGSEALDTLRCAQPPDVIVLDLMMPVMDGWELRRSMLQDPKLAGIPVIVVSGVGDGEQTAPLRASAHFTKPVNVTELLLRIEREVG